MKDKTNHMEGKKKKKRKPFPVDLLLLIILNQLLGCYLSEDDPDGTEADMSLTCLSINARVYSHTRRFTAIYKDQYIKK